MITEKNGVTTISKDQPTAEDIETVKPQLNEQQQRADIQALQVEPKIPELPEERYASLMGSFTRMFSKEARRISAERGEKAFIKKQADLANVEVRAREMEQVKEADFDTTEAHQLNFDTINDADDITAELAKMNEVNKEAINTQRRNVVPDVEMKELANDLNANPDSIRKVMGLKPGEIVPPEYVVTMRQTLTQSAKRLKGLAERIQQGNATDKEKIMFHKQWEFHSQYTQQFMGVRAEYGRGVRAFGIDIGEEQVPMTELMNRLSSGQLDTDNMAHQILLSSDNKSLNAVVTTQKGWLSKTSDIFHEVFISSILSGVQTHVVNTSSNAFKAILMPLDTFVASYVKTDGAEIGKGEAAAQIRGMFESNYEALITAWKVAKTGEAYGGASKVDVDYVKAISANALGIKEGTTANYVDKAGKFIRFSTDNMMGAEDAFFKVLHERGKIRQLAHREAMNQRLEGQDYNDFVAYRMVNPTVEMQQEATMMGLEGTFQQELGKAGKSIQTMRGKMPGARYIMPFIKTPLNILYEGFTERTPLAMISQKYKTAMKAGGAEKQMAIAKMAVGTAFNSAILGIAMNGQVTGGYPRDPRLRQIMKDAGVKENSFVFTDENGKKSYVSFDRLEPYNTILALYANINQTIQMASMDGANPEAEKELTKLAGGLAAALTEATVNKTFMSGLKQFIEVANDPLRYSEGYMSNFTTAFIPHSSAMKNVTRMLDPIVRDAQGVLDRVGKNIPMLSENHVPILDNFGKEIEFDNNLLPTFLKPGQSGSDDKVRNELLRVMEITKEAPIYKPRKTMAGYQLTSEEYYFYTYRATKTKRDGKDLHAAIKEQINSREYKESNDYVKSMMMEIVRNAYYDAAKAELTIKYPHIRKYSLDKKEYKMRLLENLKEF